MGSEELNCRSSVVSPAEIRLRYSVFTNREKWCISALVSYAAFFSTLSSFIYYPAIPSMSDSLSVSIEQINWTVTSYMAVATIGPTLIGDAADLHGRRPVYITVLSIYIATCVAIAAAESYPALVGLRVVQALAISGGLKLTEREYHTADLEQERFLSLTESSQILHRPPNEARLRA